MEVHQLTERNFITREPFCGCDGVIVTVRQECVILPILAVGRLFLARKVQVGDAGRSVSKDTNQLSDNAANRACKNEQQKCK